MLYRGGFETEKAKSGDDSSSYESYFFDDILDFGKILNSALMSFNTSCNENNDDIHLIRRDSREKLISKSI